jgi:dienelactone hydrolase
MTMDMGAALDPHAHVDARGAEVASAEVREAPAGAWSTLRWADLGATPREPGEVEVRVRVRVDPGGAGGADAGAGADIAVPVCAGRGRVTIDGAEARPSVASAASAASVTAPAGPFVAHVGPGAHEVVIAVRVSKYERRVACGGAVRVGHALRTTEGLGVLAFSSPHADARSGGPNAGGRAVVYVPPGHDATRPAAVLVGLHPWNGTMWTYAAYAELLDEARTRDVVVLLPSGLGNSLYTADAEDEAMRAIDALGEVLAVDPRRVSIWGASMGGAGATTVGLHHPDRFASITSYFGDAKYDMTTYVRGILRDTAGAHAVDAVDVADNARWVPVWLVHGEDDRTSPIRQSEVLDAALRARGYEVRFDRVPGMGHAGALVARFLRAVVDRAATARVPEGPPRVTYHAVRPWDTGAYGVHLTRAARTEAAGRAAAASPVAPGADAFVDVERRADGIHLLRADGVRAVTIDPGALGSMGSHTTGSHTTAGAGDAPPPLVNDTGRAIDLTWTNASPGGSR